jgi:hypothetical protein
LTNDDIEEEDIRAPIPQKQETLIQYGYEGYPMNNREQNRKARIRTVFDGFRNFGNEASSHAPEVNALVNKGKRRTLEELFKPPLDIMYKGDWQSARDAATAAKKWLLVNIQDAGEFQCQTLNRDVWSNDAVKTIVREHFLFWQDGNLIDADEDDQIAAAIQASLAESEKPTSSDNCNSTNTIGSCSSRAVDTYNTDTPSDSDIETCSGDDSNLSTPTKKASSINVKSDSVSVPARQKNLQINEAECAPSLEEADWKDHLGDENDAKSSIMIRFPDGRKETKNIPCTSKFMAIIKFVVSQGYPLERYEIVTNFPRRILTDLDDTQSLKDLKLFPQETIFVQQRS